MRKRERISTKEKKKQNENMEGNTEKYTEYWKESQFLCEKCLTRPKHVSVALYLSAVNYWMKYETRFQMFEQWECWQPAFMFSWLQFSYIDADGLPVPVVQLTFLRLLSATGRQTFTYTCQNSAGWYDSASRSHQHALRFRASNDEEMTHVKTPFITPLYDGCQVSTPVRLCCV